MSEGEKQKAEQQQKQDGKQKRCTCVKMAAGFGCTLSTVMLVVYLTGWGRAIPWGFGGWSVENKAGRVPEFDQFLYDNAPMLSDPEEVKHQLPNFIELSRSIITDAECTQYYTKMLMKVSDVGLDAAMAAEREIINREIALSLTKEGSKSLAYVMKKRHILDAFVDAASLHAWPNIKPNLRQEL